MVNTSRPRTVCVLGFGRSGTSLTMQVLKALGVELGSEDDMLVPHEGDNPRGYWEPRWMVELNDEILAALGTTWWKPFPGLPGWQDAPSIAPLRQRATALFADKLGNAQLAGVKDPRTTLTLPLWQAILPDPAYVICIRNPIDAIASVQRRPDPTLSMREWGELWLEYTARALRDTAGRRRLIVFYADYFRDVDAQISRMSALLGDAPDEERVRSARTLIERRLQHHRSSSVELAVASGLSAPVRTAFLTLLAAQKLRSAVDDEETTDVCDAIERVVVDAWEASRDATAARERATDLDVVNAQLEAAHAREQELTASLAHAHDEMDRRYRDLTTMQRSLSWRATAPLRAVRRGSGVNRPRTPGA